MIKCMITIFVVSVQLIDFLIILFELNWLFFEIVNIVGLIYVVNNIPVLCFYFGFFSDVETEDFIHLCCLLITSVECL